MRKLQDSTQLTLYRKLQVTKTLLLNILLVTSCADSAVNDQVDLSTPEATITAYCQAKKAQNVEVIKKCFYPQIKLGKDIGKVIWTECRIVEKRPTDKVGQDLSQETGLIVEVDDIEIVTEVRMIDQSKEHPTTRFWYLLRNLSGEWKIISHAHIPDSHYPAYD